MAPGRSRSNSHIQARSISPNVQKQGPKQRSHRGPTQATNSPTPAPARAAKPLKNEHLSTVLTPEPTVELGMTPADRYYTNLRVLRRRDPHIVSIFDQFAHVTIYYVNDENQQERAGYEGTMFLFERDIEPTYGLFILNRQGMNDYIRYLLHDDVFEPSGDIIWISTLQPAEPNAMGDEDRTTGFWAMPMDVRESHVDVLMRLAVHLRRGERYPDEYRYGPDTVVPQQTYFSGGVRNDVQYDIFYGMSEETKEKVAAAIREGQLKSQEVQSGNGDILKTHTKTASSGNILPQSQSSMSELDMLFSKLTPSAPPLPDPTPPAPQQPLTGRALLESMFASASISKPVEHQHKPSINGTGQKLTLEQLGLGPTVSTVPLGMEIISPKPSAAGLPQILTTNVIHELMGLPSSGSRSASRTSTSASTSDCQQSPGSSKARRKEKGYVADEGEDNGVESANSTDMEGSVQIPLSDRINAAGRPSFLSATNSGSSIHTKGDATPRARVEPLGLASPTKVNSRIVVAPSQSFQSFQSGADLWPSSITGSNGDLVNEIEEEEDVVELDFSNIKALDNLHSSTEKKVKPRVKSPNNSTKAAKPVVVKANGTSVPVNGSANPGNPRTVKQENTKVSSINKNNTNGSNSHILLTQTNPGEIKQGVVGRSLQSALIESGLLRADGQTLERNAFVREVLTLIHTDKSFVDKMYQTYKTNVVNPS